MPVTDTPLPVLRVRLINLQRQMQTCLHRADQAAGYGDYAVIEHDLREVKRLIHDARALHDEILARERAEAPTT